MHCFRRITLILAAMAGLLLGVGIPSATNGPAHAADRTTLARAGSILAAEGTLAECVFAYVGQGLPLAEAAKNCEVSVTAVPGGADLPAAGGGSIAMNGFRNTAGGPLTVSCPTAGGTDPALASDAKGARDAAQSALDNFDRTHPNATGRAAAERAELSKQLTEAQQKLNDASTDYLQREKDAAETKRMLDDAAATKSSQPSTPATTPPTAAPVTNPPATTPPATSPPNTSPVTTPGSSPAHPAAGANEACEAFAAFVGECNLAGWATEPCQALRRQLRGCKDMTMAYTTGDDPNVGCPADKPDAATVAHIVELHCMSRAKVAPGYDPCAPPDLGGGPGVYRDPNADPCTGKNPWALMTGDGCEVTVNESPDFGLGPTIDPSIILVLGGPGVPTVNTPPPYRPTN